MYQFQSLITTKVGKEYQNLKKLYMKDYKGICFLWIEYAWVHKYCNPFFFSRFLNEMIKLISPKYLGTRSPDSVKQKVIELLYSWTKQFPRVCTNVCTTVCPREMLTLPYNYFCTLSSDSVKQKGIELTDPWSVVMSVYMSLALCFVNVYMFPFFGF